MDQIGFIVVVVVIFLLFMVLPQTMQRRRHEQELASIRPGAWVVTVGGIIGQVISIDATEAKLRISPMGEITMVRQAIRSRIAPRQPFGGEEETLSEPETPKESADVADRRRS